MYDYEDIQNKFITFCISIPLTLKETQGNLNYPHLNKTIIAQKHLSSGRDN